MKRFFLTMTISLLIGFGFFISCSKNGTQALEEKLSTITTIYERSNPAETDTSMWAEHVIMIEEITRNDGSLDKYKSDHSWTQYVAQNIDTSKSILRYTYDNSPIQVITVPLVTQYKSEVALIYASRDTFMFAICFVNSLSNTNLKYVLKPVGISDLYYSFEVTTDSDRYIGNIEFENDMPFYETFGNRSGGPDCHDRYPNNFKECMKCSLRDCYNRWWCKFIIGPPGIIGDYGVGMAAGWVLGCA